MHISLLLQTLFFIIPAYFYGWIIGGVAFTAYMTLNKITIEKLSGGILVSAADEAWETIEKKQFITAWAKVDKLTAAQFKRDYSKRIARIPKLRSVVRVFLGRYLWLPLSEHELLSKLDTLITKNKVWAHTDDQLRQIYREGYSHYDPLKTAEKPLWAIHIIENFSDTQSAYVVQCHGALYADLRRIFKPLRKMQMDDATQNDKPKENWPQQRSEFVG